MSPSIIRTYALAALLLLLFAPMASAVNIGAGPGIIDFGKMIKGGYAEKVITVSTSGDEDLTCSIEYAGDLKDWLTIDQGEQFQLKKNSRVDLKIYAQPPLDVANGKYEGGVYIKAAPTSSITSGAGLAVGAGVKILLLVEISGKEEVSIMVKNLIIKDTEIGYPLKFASLVKNNGNIRANPKFEITISDPGGKQILTGEYADTTILPTKEENIQFTLPSDKLETGQYSAKIDVLEKNNLIYNKIATFNILPRGTWSVSGTLDEILLSADTTTPGELIKVTGIFKNTGEARTTGKFKAEAYLDDKLSDLLRESDEIGVDPGKTAQLDSYFTPKKEGNYIIRGYVTYNGEKTGLRSTVLKVAAPPLSVDPTMIALILAILIVIIAAYLKFRKNTQQNEYANYYPPQQEYQQIPQQENLQQTQPEQQEQNPPQQTQ
ncbi:MAG: hypothetical protein V1875_01645 [Candidatus Altiarchaeota archaeon]